MTLQQRAWVFGLAIAAAASLAGVLKAKDVQFVTFAELQQQSERINQLENELAALRAGECEQGCCDSGCCSCACPGWIAGLELAVLQPHIGSLQIDPGGGALAITPEFDSEASPRIFLGYKGSEGLGARVRYWQFDHSAQTSIAGLVDLSLRLENHALDFEFMQDGEFWNWDVEIAGGFRYGKLGLGIDANILFFPFNAAVTFEGVGPTVAMAARRPFGSRGLALVAGARGSFMYGDSRFNGPQILVNQIRVSQHLMQAWEFQVGAEWSRTTSAGSEIFARAAYEAQVWEWAPSLGILSMDIGYVGPTFSIGITR